MHNWIGLAPALTGTMRGKPVSDSTSTLVKLGLVPAVKGCPNRPSSLGAAEAMMVAVVQGSERDGQAVYLVTPLGRNSLPRMMEGSVAGGAALMGPVMARRGAMRVRTFDFMVFLGDV